MEGLPALCPVTGRLPLPGLHRWLPQLSSVPQHLLGAQVSASPVPVLPFPCQAFAPVPGLPWPGDSWCWCPGRGLLQFENVSYGIQPLGNAPAFQHVLYRVREGQRAAAPPAHSPPEAGLAGLAAWDVLDKAQEDDEVSRACPPVLLLSLGCRRGLAPQGALATHCTQALKGPWRAQPGAAVRAENADSVL